MERFSIEQDGYNKDEVKKFINDVIRETEDIIKRVQTQQVQLTTLTEKLNHYQERERTLENALYQAEETSNNIKKQAKEEATIIINDAKSNASRIVNDALLRAEKIELNADTLERNIRIFKKKLKLIVEQQLAVVDEIEEIEFR